MNISKKTIRKYFDELEKCNLIYVEKQNKIYLTNFIEYKHGEKLLTNNNIINNTYMNKRKSFNTNYKSEYNNFSGND